MASRLNDNQLNSRFIDQIFARLRKLIVSDDGVNLLQGYCHIVGLLGIFAGVADQHGTFSGSGVVMPLRSKEEAERKAISMA